MNPLFCTKRATVKREIYTISSWTGQRPIPYSLCMNTKREVGRRLKLARNRLGLSLQEVCDSVPALGGNPSKLGNYESGRRAPDLDMIKAIAKVLHTDPSWLATLIDDEPDQRTAMLIRYYQGSDERGKDSIFRTAEIQLRYEESVIDEDDPPQSLCG